MFLRAADRRHHQPGSASVEEACQLPHILIDITSGEHLWERKAILVSDISTVFCYLSQNILSDSLVSYILN